MRAWNPYLQSCHPPFKGSYLNEDENDPSLIIDFRTPTSDSTLWYVKRLGPSCECINHPLSQKDLPVQDLGPLLKLCVKVNRAIQEKKEVILIGDAICDAFAIVCHWWNRHANSEVTKEHDCIKELRDALDFQTANSKDLQHLIRSLQKEGAPMIRWQSFGNKKLKK